MDFSIPVGIQQTLDGLDEFIEREGGVGCSRHMPFEHISRHHRRDCITAGAEEIQTRKVAKHLFGFGRTSATPVSNEWQRTA